MFIELWRRWIDPYDLRLTPAAGASRPSTWMSLSGLRIDLVTSCADGDSLTAVALVRRHELDAAMAVFMVIPLHKGRHPQAGLLFGSEWAVGVVRPVFDRAEQGFRVRVVIADPWPGKGSQHSQLLKAGFQGGGSHGITVVGMEDQGPLAAFADPLPQAGPADQIRGDAGIFPILHIPSHHLAAPNVHHQVEIQPDSPHTGGQVGDVPTPDFIGALGFQARHRPGLLGRFGTATAVGLVMLMEHPIEAAL